MTVLMRARELNNDPSLGDFILIVSHCGRYVDLRGGLDLSQKLGGIVPFDCCR